MSAPSSLPRGLITARLIAELAERGLPVGDAEEPVAGDYGWQGDQPNDDGSNSIPWMTSQTGAASAPTGSMGDSQTEWRLNYAVIYAAVSRAQAEWIADEMRGKLVRIERESLLHEASSTSWRIQQVRAPGIGAIQQIKSGFPDYFQQADSFEVWVTKERS